MGPQVQLRPYQSEAVVKLFESLPKHHRVLISMPTGVGKTIVGMYAATAWPEVCDVFGLPQRVLWLAHREELVYQAVEQFRNVAAKKRGLRRPTTA